MDEVDELLRKVQQEINLEQKSNFVIAPTAPSRFQEREDKELASRFHNLFNVPHVTSAPSESDIQARFRKLNENTDYAAKNTKNTQTTTSKKNQHTKITDPEMKNLWEKFNLSEVTEPNEDEDFLEEEIDDDELLNVIQSCIDYED